MPAGSLGQKGNNWGALTQRSQGSFHTNKDSGMESCGEATKKVGLTEHSHGVSEQPARPHRQRKSLRQWIVTQNFQTKLLFNLHLHTCFKNIHLTIIVMESYLLKDVHVLPLLPSQGEEDTNQSGEGIVSEMVSKKISLHLSFLLFTSIF